MANVTRIRKLTVEENLVGDEYIPIDRDDYLDNAKSIHLSTFNKYITGVTYSFTSGLTSGSSGSSGTSGSSGSSGLSGDIITGITFEEQDGSIELDGFFSLYGYGMLHTHIYFTGMTDDKSFESPVQDGNILVYSAVTSSSGFWYPTGATFYSGTDGSSGSSGTDGSSGSSGSSGTDGSSGSSGTDGSSGSSGSSGTNGSSGSSGSSGTDGTSGSSGSNSTWCPIYVYTGYTSIIIVNGDSTSYVKVGLPIKYNDLFTDYYGIITGVTYTGGYTYIGVDGPPCNVVPMGEYAWIGQPYMLHVETFAINGAYAAVANNTLLEMATNTYFKWYTNTAYLVRFNVRHKINASTTQPKINITINGASVSNANYSSGITVGTSWSSTLTDINSSNYIINFDDTLEIKTNADAGTTHASDLTVQTTFVLIPVDCNYSPPM